MALITCPECGGTVSDTAITCPHCGYALSANAVVETTSNTVYQNVTHNGYDVMLVDYMKGKLYTSNKIAEVIDCSIIEASKLLNNLPCYLYNDLSYNDALYIAQSLQYYGCRIALYDPNGTATYYAPVGYNKALPSLFNIVRNPFFSVVPPRRHEFVIRRQRMPEVPKPRNVARPRMDMPKPNQQPHSNMNRHDEPRSMSNNRGGQSHGNNRPMGGSHNGGPKGGRGH